jgi:hypothetical protein
VAGRGSTGLRLRRHGGLNYCYAVYECCDMLLLVMYR